MRSYLSHVPLHWKNRELVLAVLVDSMEQLIQFFIRMDFPLCSVLYQLLPKKEMDEGVHWGIRNGLDLSRSNIIYFKHNDIDSLRSTLESVTAENQRAKKLRRYIVIEAVYQNSGQIVPQDEIIRLKEKYRFRVSLDESNPFGVLGRTGRGLTEHFGVEKIDIITAAMGHALATEGGFCTGSARVVDHQYIYRRASIAAAITAIDVLEETPGLITKLKENIAIIWEGLSGIAGLSIASNPDSPTVFLKLEKSTGSLKANMDLLQDIADRVLKEDSVLVLTSKRSTIDECPLPFGIKLFVSAGHSKSDLLLKASESLKRVAGSVLKGYT
ncbi:Glycine dehydrogenase (decarboxylating) [Parasponia andersonii]|uniref:serine C-palmitoyltransferase n=1 Tax=Parasponia andersonii TaxID=3476 RepID=A0A2P5DNM2_PARAD|nr:Glycine dehydrogenase (decarboxylating) [Parasponia andersonii]